jgi:hypothetical protein
MLSVIILNGIILIGIVLNVIRLTGIVVRSIMLGVILISVNMPSGIILGGNMLSDIALTVIRLTIIIVSGVIIGWHYAEYHKGSFLSIRLKSIMLGIVVLVVAAPFKKIQAGQQLFQKSLMLLLFTVFK